MARRTAGAFQSYLPIVARQAAFDGVLPGAPRPTPVAAPSSLELIGRAEAAGRIGPAQAALYRLQSVHGNHLLDWSVAMVVSSGCRVA